ncbi:unnamed protein product [Discosporangium mesarthrocarpum]
MQPPCARSNGTLGGLLLVALATILSTMPLQWSTNNFFALGVAAPDTVASDSPKAWVDASVDARGEVQVEDEEVRKTDSSGTTRQTVPQFFLRQPKVNMRMDFNELENVEFLNMGGLCTVYKATLHGEKVVVKVARDNPPWAEFDVMKEVDILSKLDHPNIIRLMGAGFVAPFDVDIDGRMRPATKFERNPHPHHDLPNMYRDEYLEGKIEREEAEQMEGKGGAQEDLQDDADVQDEEWFNPLAEAEAEAAEGRKAFAVLEWLGGGTLVDLMDVKSKHAEDVVGYITRRRNFPIKRVLEVAIGLCNALEYLHTEATGEASSFIMHRDMKPENVMFDESGVPKLIDASMAAVVNGFFNEKYQMSGDVGNARYMAPEVARGKAYNWSADVYGFGLILWQMLTFKEVYDGLVYLTSSGATVPGWRDEWKERVVEGGYRPPMREDWSDDTKSLLNRCWGDPDKRPSMSEVKSELQSLLIKGIYRDESPVEGDVAKMEEK